MTEKTLDRRQFVKTAAAAGIAATLALPGRVRGAEKRYPIRLGGPLKVPQEPEEMALAYRKVGYRAAYCPPVSLKEPEKIRAISQAFKKHDVVIAEVGRWVNLLDQDVVARKKHLEQVTEGLALADAIGARCCVDIAGSYNEKVWYGPHPDNLSDRFFEEAVENARKIIDAVKPRRAKFSYEMMGWALPDSPDSYVDFIKAVDRDAFAVHLDPCNLVNSPRRFYGNTALLEECFDKLGRWIVSCHAKDLAWDIEMNVHFREVQPGTGSMDYKNYLRRLSMLPQSPPLMLEHLSSADEYDKARVHILDLGKSMDLDI